jgi:regulator of sigma E protease
MQYLQIILNLPIYIFWFIVVMIPLVTIHEFGHFIFARLFKVKVPEFGIGVPPKAYGKRWKGMIWSLNWIPLGAFVRIQGDNDSFDIANSSIENNQKTKEDFVNNRYLEVIQLNDVETILNESYVPFDDKWKHFAKKANNKKFFENPEMIEYTQKLKTLISNEYDAYFKNKNKFNFNSLYFTKNIFQKILILVGGVTFNILGAFLIFVIALNSVGLFASNTFENRSGVEYPILLQGKNIVNIDGSQHDMSERKLLVGGDEKNPLPTYKTGIPNQSKLISINNTEVKNLNNNNLAEIIKNDDDKKIDIKYLDSGQEITKTVEAQKVGENYSIGALLTNTVKYKSSNFFTSIKDAYDHTIYYTIYITNTTFKFLGDIVTPSKSKDAFNQTSSPLMISFVSKSIFDQFGLSAVLWLMALISISLAVFNLLPIPALDGGRILLTILQTIFGKGVKKIEPYLVTTTYIFLLVFMFLVLGKDAITLFKNSIR